MMASMYTRTSSSIEAVKMLVWSGADMDFRGINGWTALAVAVMSSLIEGTLETVQFLLEEGADPKIRDYDGLSVIDIAEAMSREEPGGTEVLKIIQDFIQKKELELYSEIMEKYKCDAEIAKMIKIRNITDKDIETHEIVLKSLAGLRINPCSIFEEPWSNEIDTVIASNRYWYRLSELHQLKDDLCPYTRVPLDEIPVTYCIFGSIDLGLAKYMGTEGFISKILLRIIS